MADELKPCPFCGSKAEIQWESTQGFVSCTNEDCYATSTWFSSDDARWVTEQIVSRWNRRAEVRKPMRVIRQADFVINLDDD